MRIRNWCHMARMHDEFIRSMFVTTPCPGLYLVYISQFEFFQEHTLPHTAAAAPTAVLYYGRGCLLFSWGVSLFLPQGNASFHTGNTFFTRGTSFTGTPFLPQNMYSLPVVGLGKRIAYKSNLTVADSLLGNNKQQTKLTRSRRSNSQQGVAQIIVEDNGPLPRPLPIFRGIGIAISSNPPSISSHFFFRPEVDQRAEVGSSVQAVSDS